MCLALVESIYLHQPSAAEKTRLLSLNAILLLILNVAALNYTDVMIGVTVQRQELSGSNLQV